jgi:hypothetical protein
MQMHMLEAACLDSVSTKGLGHFIAITPRWDYRMKWRKNERAGLCPLIRTGERVVLLIARFLASMRAV